MVISASARTISKALCAGAMRWAFATPTMDAGPSLVGIKFSCMTLMANASKFINRMFLIDPVFQPRPLGYLGVHHDESISIDSIVPTVKQR
jgi:hypothetical protein